MNNLKATITVKEIMTITKKELELLNGNQLAKLLNKLDLQGREEDAILVESEMDFRYEYWFKYKLIESNK